MFPTLYMNFLFFLFFAVSQSCPKNKIPYFSTILPLLHFHVLLYESPVIMR